MFKKLKDLKQNLLLVAFFTILFSCSFTSLQAQDCWGTGSSLCGGPSSACTPVLDPISVSITGIDPAGNITFAVTISGSGFSGGNGANGSIYSLSISSGPPPPGSGSTPRGGCSIPEGECGSCSETVTWTQQVPEGAITIYASGRESYYGGICGCDFEETYSIAELLDPTNTPGPENIEADPTEFGIPTETNMFVGDPINVTNGNMYLERTDISIGTDVGLPIEFKRFYNSGGRFFLGPYASGWTHSYQSRIEVDVSVNALTGLNEYGNIHLYTEDGRDIEFRKIMGILGYEHIAPDGVYEIFNWGSGNYTESSWNLRIKGEDDLIRGYEQYESYPGVPTINHKFRLAYIEDLHGNRTNISYHPHVIGDRPLISKVTGASDKWINLYYNDDNLLETITSKWGANLISYEYYSTGYLERATFPDGSWEQYNANISIRIDQVVNSDGYEWNYRYVWAGTSIYDGFLAVQSFGEGGIENISITYNKVGSGVTSYLESVVDLGGGNYATYKSRWDSNRKRKYLETVENAENDGNRAHYQVDTLGNRTLISSGLATIREDMNLPRFDGQQVKKYIPL